jgi:hypothetical protein
VQRVRLHQQSLEVDAIEQLAQRRNLTAGISGVGALGNGHPKAVGVEADLGNETRCARSGLSDRSPQCLAVAHQGVDRVGDARLRQQPLQQQGFEPLDIKLSKQEAEDRVRGGLGDVGAEQFVENLAVADRQRGGWILSAQPRWQGTSVGLALEPVTTSSQLLLWEAIDQVHAAAEGPELLLDDLAECVVALLSPLLSLQQISDAAEGMIRMAERPDRPPAARPIPVVDVQAVLERALNLLDWQELEDDDDRSDIQKLIDNATDADTVLVRDPSGTPELQEIGILELLQRYPCRGSKARWSPNDAIAFLETKTRWLDAALENWEADGEDFDAASDLIEAKAVVLVVPEQPGQALRTELHDVLIPVDS